MPRIDQPIADDTPPARSGWIREALIIACLTLTLNLAGNGRVGLWDRDEPRYATCTREMRARGDWLLPRFNDQPRYHKPILIYWLMRAGYAVGGDNPFGARLVSAFAGAATCLVTWRFGRSVVGPKAGFLAAVALATVPIMVAESKLATTDATLALLLVSAQACLWGLVGGPSRVLAASFWALMALATLLKGPVGPALIAASGVASWWFGGPTACWRRIGWKSGLVLFFVLTAPWYVAVGVLTGGDFFSFAFRTQIVQRMASGMEQHGGFPGYYAAVALPMFYPWSVLVLPATLAGWARRETRPGFGFLLGWVVGPWLVLECFQTKLIHYYLPCFPACALLVGWWVVEMARTGLDPAGWRLGRVSVLVLVVIGFGASISLVLGSFFLPTPLRGPFLAMGAALATGTSIARAAFRSGDPLRASHRLAGTWAVVMGVFVAWALPAAEPFRFSRVVGQRLGEVSRRTGVRPAIMTFQEPGVIYALGHPACDVRGFDEMFEEVRRNGPILIPLLAKEVVEMRADGRFDLEPIEPLTGFNANKGKVQSLELAVVRIRPSTLTRSGEQPLVK